MNPQNGRELDIMRLRYVDRLNWAQIGEELGVSRRKIYEIRISPKYTEIFNKIQGIISEAYEKEKQRRAENG